MSNNDESWEKAIGALLEGNLSKADADKLRDELDIDTRRAKDIINAYQIQNGLESLGVEKAPESLRKKLRAIPACHNQVHQPLLRWGVLTLIAVFSIAVLLINTRPTSDVPSTAEIVQAKRELVIAFSYLQLAGQKTGHYMRREIGVTMQDALIEGIFNGVSKEPENG